jgi:tripartite-type tricarboxylate transporter receptor subunit TctC
VSALSSLAEFVFRSARKGFTSMPRFFNSFVRAFAAAAVLGVACFGGAAHAQAWPSKPVHLLVPFPPGGPTDVTARIFADKLSAKFGQPFLVENKPGPNGVAVYNAVLAAPADGYTLAFVTTGGQALQPAINAYLKKPVEVDVNRQLIPAGMLADSPLVLLVSPSIGVNTAQELIAWVKANPAKANYASDGVGSSTHIVAEMFNDAVGIKAVHVPFKGTVASNNAIMAGDAHYAFSGVLTPLPLHRAGKLKIIAVGGSETLASLPGVPVLSDAAKLPGFDVSSWFALYVHKDVPPDRIALLNAELQRIGAMPDVIERFAGMGLQTRPMTVSALGQRVQAEYKRWSDTLARTQPKLD